MPTRQIIHDVNAPLFARSAMKYRGRQYAKGEAFDAKALGLSERQILALCMSFCIWNGPRVRVANDAGLGGMIALAALGACAAPAADAQTLDQMAEAAADPSADVDAAPVNDDPTSVPPAPPAAPAKPAKRTRAGA